MKIAFTVSDGADMSARMDSRFGRAAKFLIYDTETKAFSVIDNAYAQAGQGAGLKAAETVVKAGAVVLVTGDCGPKAFQALKNAGVKVYSAKDVSVAGALEAFNEAKLAEIASA